MRRFLMLVGVAVVAAPMYVAASPASQQSEGPTTEQFNALKKQVATLSKTLKVTKAEAKAAAGFIATCLVNPAAGILGVSQFGGTGTASGTYGYQYVNSVGGPEIPTTALDADVSAQPGAFLQAVNPACVHALRHRAPHTRTRSLLLHGERLP